MLIKQLRLEEFKEKICNLTIYEFATYNLAIYQSKLCQSSKNISLEKNFIIRSSKMQMLKKRCAVSVVYISIVSHDMQRDGEVEMPEEPAFQEERHKCVTVLNPNQAFSNPETKLDKLVVTV